MKRAEPLDLFWSLAVFPINQAERRGEQKDNGRKEVCVCCLSGGRDWEHVHAHRTVIFENNKFSSTIYMVFFIQIYKEHQFLYIFLIPFCFLCLCT